MAYSAINIYNKHLIKVNATVDIIEQTATLDPDNSATTGSLKSVDETEWKNLANINTFKVTPETEDDEIEYFDPNTHTRVKDQQTDIIRYAIEMTAVNYPVLFNAIAMGVPNPTSAETAAMLSADSEEGAPVFANNNPNVPVGMRIKFYDNKTNHMQTLYAYANIKATGEQEFNGKTMQPTLNAEIQQSVHNRMINTALFTQQTES